MIAGGTHTYSNKWQHEVLTEGLLKVNPSFTFGDSSLYTREPMKSPYTRDSYEITSKTQHIVLLGTMHKILHFFQNGLIFGLNCCILSVSPCTLASPV